MTPEEFLAWPNRAISLIGMSGVGKTTLARNLPQDSWFHYSGDYRIGTKYLSEPILDNIKKQAMQVPFLRTLLRSDSIYIANNITVENLEPVSTFLGKLGNREKGGLPLEEFRERQQLHHEAEMAAMQDVEEFIAKAHDIYGYQHFVNDAGGSVCELYSNAAIEALAEHSVIVYLRADAAMEQVLIERARTDPKPMYYQPEFLDRKLAEFLERSSLASADDIDPDEFVAWIFPELVAHRRPLYQSIADNYGYTIDVTDASGIQGEDELLQLIASAIGSQNT